MSVRGRGRSHRSGHTPPPLPGQCPASGLGSCRWSRCCTPEGGPPDRASPPPGRTVGNPPFHPRGQPGLCHLRGDGPPVPIIKIFFTRFLPFSRKKGRPPRRTALPLGFFSKRWQSRFQRDQPTLFHFSMTARSWLVIFLRSLLGLPLLAWMMATRSMAARSNSW